MVIYMGVKKVKDVVSSSPSKMIEKNDCKVGI